MKKIVLIIICFLLCSCKSEYVFKNVVIDTHIPKSNMLSLTMVGDAIVHTPIYKDAYKDGLYDFSSVFEYFKDDIKSSDLLFYNQESILGGEHLGYTGYPSFNTPASFGEEMINLGFNIVSRANNHTLDKGPTGLLNSCNFWNSHPSVLTNGSACTKEERDNIKIFEKKGVRYALLSYTMMTNGISPTNDYDVNYFSKERASEDIESIKASTDVILVSMHWGDEYKSIPSKTQREIGEYLSSLGVNIIIGTHPHVIEPIEWINNTLVIYSLGNFLSAQSTVDDYARRIGLMVNVDIIKTEINNKTIIKLDNLNTELIYTYSNGYVNYKVIPFSKLDNNLLNNYEKYKEKYNSIVKMYDKRIITN